MAELESNHGKSPNLDPTAPEGSGDSAGELARAVRPGHKARQEVLLKDLDRPGWVAISHLGQVTWKRPGSTEVSTGDLESALEEATK